MSSITSSGSDHTIKLDRLNFPASHVIRPYTNTHSDIETKSVGSKSVGSRTSKLTYSGKNRLICYFLWRLFSFRISPSSTNESTLFKYIYYSNSLISCFKSIKYSNCCWTSKKIWSTYTKTSEWLALVCSSLHFSFSTHR